MRYLAALAMMLVSVAVPETALAQGAPTAQPAQPSQPPPKPPLASQQQVTAEVWGAIAFTADGSYSSAWKAATKADAEVHVLKECAKFGRGACESIAFPGRMCAALVHYRGGSRRLSFTGGGATSPDAQRAAHENCKANKHVRGQCQLRTVVCGDGR